MMVNKRKNVVQLKLYYQKLHELSHKNLRAGLLEVASTFEKNLIFDLITVIYQTTNLCIVGGDRFGNILT